MRAALPSGRRAAESPTVEVPGSTSRGGGDESATATPELEVAVVIPCYNEESTIGDVVRDFTMALPEATVYVYDNNSTDLTTHVAQSAGAIVRREYLQGKGNVIRRMFADVDADVYVLVDGDATYDAGSARRMIERLLEGPNDMVSALRVADLADAYRSGRRFGNVLLSKMVGLIFGKQFNDMLSGFRVMSRRFVKSFPALSRGFDTETELTIHALELRISAAEVETPYRPRPAGSVSKLHTFRDGCRIPPYADNHDQGGATTAVLRLAICIPAIDILVHRMAGSP